MSEDNTILDREQVREILRGRGISPTRQRVEIGQVLFAEHQHVSAEQVLDRVNRVGGAASKATVYNTLGLFASKGLLREVLIDPNKVFYDTNTHDHHHIYNVESGELTDVDAHEIVIHKLPELPEGTRPEGVDVVIRVRSESR